MVVFRSIQIIAAITAIILVIHTLRQFYRKRIGLGGMLFWIFIWILLLASMILISFEPLMFEFLSVIFMTELPLNAALILGVIILFFTSYELYLSRVNTDRDITEIVRHLAIMEEKIDSIAESIKFKEPKE
ncbi:DUF2304 family protein [Candidatus Borrarchaeum sp.]|uniref:DUF2304 family protein n=1 Tax=Candidatus Borrarchaeum sp. TaxID=2846742 RepID=UPI00257D6533|nr:DUF2304 family protein [Candidatus Borrarchaeum sp.]